jgi:ADP-ribosylglycohydrolase
LDHREWLEEIVAAEIVQKREEGCDPLDLERRFGADKDSMSEKQLEEFWGRVNSLRPERPNYVEPSTLEAVLNETSLPQDRGQVKVNSLWERISGAWIGRCAGCLLGKPVEGWTKARIERHLRECEAYPLTDYFPACNGDGEDRRYMLKGGIGGMPRDDDLDYTILGLHMAEDHGLRITSEEIGEEWLDHLPYRSVYTAERVAYRNLVNMIPIPDTATYLNPYREWIGAQIRADIWGFIHPGRPRMASELAFRDARVSHVKNGIYGEMMAAAMVSKAFTSGDPLEIVDVGLSAIPAKSRLHEAVEDVIGWSQDLGSWTECWRLMEDTYGHYSPVHTINNALNVICALVYGGGDFGRTIGIAVMCGWDTDCNGATTGSIVGAMVGSGGIPDRWSDPLEDRIESHVRGFTRNRISDLARRTFDLACRTRS